jgi:hypothetical protein
MAVDCPFLKNKERSFTNITSFNASLETLVDSKEKYREYFFIIDNTDFPLFKIDPFNNQPSLQ